MWDTSRNPRNCTDRNEALALEVGEQLLFAITLGEWDQAEALATQAARVLRQLATDQKSGTRAVPGLTEAELRLLPLLSTHLSYREVGERLFVSKNTVKSQAYSAYRKLGVSSRSAAVLRARKLGFVD